MSRFIDKMLRLRQSKSRPMGFAIGTASSEGNRMQIVVNLKPGAIENVSGKLDMADALLVEINKLADTSMLDKACGIKEGLPAGGWLKAADKKTFKNISSNSCDFIVFPADLPVAFTQKEKLGRILEVDASLSEGLLRTANDLPVDAVLLSWAGEEPLNFSRLMLVQRAAYLVTRPILVSISGNYSTAELQALWDTGVSGVVVEATDEKSVEKLADLRKAVNELKTTTRKIKITPLLPHIQAESPLPQEGEEEEEEEDE